jgi:uncharacterized protein YjbI with pentapeptide repeats
MTEDNNNQNDQPTDEQKSSLEYKPKLRKISQDELRQILRDHRSGGKKKKQADLSNVHFLNINRSEDNPQEAIFLQEHEKWLETNGKEGKQADLERVNLQGANFSGANLQKADLHEANLQKADLGEADLQEAYLEGANLQEADLRKANLKEAFLYMVNFQEATLYKANLQKANLEGANLRQANLIRANLQQADLAGTKLHKADMSKADMQNTVLDGVKGLAEANLKHANIEGATGLLGNEFAQADVTGTKLPDDIKEFKALETVKETSQNARKIFFAMILGCVYSWLTIATTTDVRLLTNTASSPLPIIGTEIPIAWFYLAAPLVLISLFLYFHFYLIGLWESLASLPAIFPDGKRLDERAYPWLLNRLARKHFKRLKAERSIITKIQELVVIVLAWWVVPITMVGFWLRYLVRHELIGTLIHIVLLVILISSSIIFYNLCKLALQGNDIKTFKLFDFWNDRKSDWVIIVGFILILLSNFGFTNWGANFREKDISIKPSDYYKIETVEKQIESVKGANLKGRNLNNADMYKAFLVKADLRGALLNDANLAQANLQNANLEKANLQEADLYNANLQKSDLYNANLQQADLYKASLQQAELSDANLQQARLVEANLQEASLLVVNLQQANLVSANLQEAELFQANLQEAQLLEANLRQAELLEANLQQASLREANLTGAKNLTIDQLSKVKTLYKTKLDPDLLEQVKKCCPHLLEEPKEEPDKTK